MGKINGDWHAAHRMPKKPTSDQRAEWHVAHLDACGCRAPSDAEALLIAAYKAKLDAQLA